MPLKYGVLRARARESAPTFPDRVYVESTNVCNLDCIMCPTGLHIDTRPKGYMEWDLYTPIIDEIAPFAEAVVLHSWGEPLLHKRIIDMIQYAKDRDLWVETSTNAMRLTEEVSRQLLDAGLDRIYLSMDGLTKETYEKVRVKGKFEGVLGNIERFLDLKHELRLADRGRHPDRAPLRDRLRGRGVRRAVEGEPRRPDQHQGARHLGRPDRRGRSLAVDEEPSDDRERRPQAVPEPLVPRAHPLGRRRSSRARATTTRSRRSATSRTAAC